MDGRDDSLWYEQTLKTKAERRTFARALAVVQPYAAWRLYVNGTGGVPLGPGGWLERTLTRFLGRLAQ